MTDDSCFCGEVVKAVAMNGIFLVVGSNNLAQTCYLVDGGSNAGCAICSILHVHSPKRDEIILGMCSKMIVAMCTQQTFHSKNIK